MRTHCDHGLLWLPPETPWPGGSNPHCKPCWRAAGGAVVAGGKAAATPPRSPCQHLGRQVSPTDTVPCGRTYECDRGHGQVCPRRECRTCPDWEADSDTVAATTDED